MAIKATTGINPEALNHRAAYTLFVEGKDADAIDPTVLSRLLSSTPITVKAMGSSYHMKSVAKALHAHHPTYFFIVDRDHHLDAEVEKSWQNFPDPRAHNLLIWRRKEFENYFIDPKYLAHSSFLRPSVSGAKLEATLLKHAALRIFMDTANLVISQVRESQKANWIELYKKPTDFPDAAAALGKLKTHSNFPARSSDITQQVSASELERQFNVILQNMLEGKSKPAVGFGKWMHLMAGKPLLNALVAECLDVTDSEGKQLSGNAALVQVAADLLAKNPPDEPVDFGELRTLIEGCVK